MDHETIIPKLQEAVRCAKTGEAKLRFDPSENVSEPKIPISTLTVTAEGGTCTIDGMGLLRSLADFVGGDPQARTFDVRWGDGPTQAMIGGRVDDRVFEIILRVE